MTPCIVYASFVSNEQQIINTPALNWASQSFGGRFDIGFTTSKKEPYTEKRNEPPHDKSNKMICAQSEDSDQPGHPPSLIRVFAVHSMGNFLHADSEDSDQTRRMPRLI